MNEHTIRGIAEVAYEGHRAYLKTALGHDKPEFDELPDDEMDAVVDWTRDILVKLSENPNYSDNNPTKKVFTAVVKTLAKNPNLV